MLNDNEYLRVQQKDQSGKNADLDTEGPKSSLVSRNITIMKRRTSVRLEPEMWSALREISRREKCTIHDLCTLISVRKSPATSLTAAIRVFLMLYFRAAANEEGHVRAGHGNFDFMRQRAKVPSQAFSLIRSGKGPAKSVSRPTNANTAHVSNMN
jgi:predicted DNA-binding ribbon-helix-helix protein